MLSVEIEPDWDPAIREQWITNQRRGREVLLHEFGVLDGERKIADYIALGASPFSVMALHNLHLAQVRSAFTLGAYYPALVGAGSLGERLLNHLILALCNDYADNPATSRVATTESIADWRRAIGALRA